MKNGKLLDFLHAEPLDNSLLIGFYGGGNYGDELLMEVLAGLLRKQGTEDVSIAYQLPELYGKYHHEFGFEIVDMGNKASLLEAILGKKNIVIGGGGLWGMDSNFNILLMSIMLLISRKLFRKNVYLLEVGYYQSTSGVGRLGAWCAAKAANLILARDPESYRNFKRLQPNTVQDTDIAWYIDELELGAYQHDLEALEERIRIPTGGKTLFMTLRRFRDEQQDQLHDLVDSCIAANADKNIILALMEPRHIDPAGYRQLLNWQRQFPNLQVVDFGCNPIALFLFFRKYHDQLVFIGPQFHGILSAHLNSIPYFPLAYDNKVRGLLKSIAPQLKPVRLKALRALDIQRFIDTSYKEI